MTQISPRPTFGPSESMIRPAMPVTAPTRCTAGACRTWERRTSTNGPTVTALMTRPPPTACSLLDYNGSYRHGSPFCSLIDYKGSWDGWWWLSFSGQPVREHGKLGLLAGVGEAEAAAHLAVAGSEARILPDLQARVARNP